MNINVETIYLILNFFVIKEKQLKKLSFKTTVVTPFDYKTNFLYLNVQLVLNLIYNITI